MYNPCIEKNEKGEKVTKAELRKAVQIMDEDTMIGLYCFYEGIQDRRPDEDEGGYKAKMRILDAEDQRRRNPNHRSKVDPVLCRKIGFWKGL